MNLIIGSHVGFLNSTQLLGSVKEAISYKANTFMIYTGSTQSTQRSEINDKLTYEALDLMIKNNINIKNVIVHAPYIINFANKSDEKKYEFYIDFFVKELERCKRLGLDKIVLHPGSAVNCTHEEGIFNIANAINITLERTKDVKVLFEFMSGKGNEVGININELSNIIELIHNKDRIGVCLDTCHINDSGVDLKKFNEFLDEFDEIIGIDKINCVHVNDSLNQIGEHKDRHANIGYGTIGFETLINVIYNDRLIGTPFILETPYVKRNQKDEYAPYKYEIESIRNKKFIEFINL